MAADSTFEFLATAPYFVSLPDPALAKAFCDGFWIRVHSKREKIENRAWPQCKCIFGFRPKRAGYDALYDRVEAIFQRPASDDQGLLCSCYGKVVSG